MTSNTFLVTGDRPVLVDTGANFDVVSAVEDVGSGLDAVVLTHTHFDHVDNLEAIQAAFDVEVWGYDPDTGFVDHPVGDGDRVQLGDEEYVAIHTPGHKTDHLCYYAPETGVLFAGDLVFANGGFGRTDLDEGDRGQLIDSIDRVLEVADEITEVHSGHGPSITTNARQSVELALNAAKTRA